MAGQLWTDFSIDTQFTVSGYIRAEPSSNSSLLNTSSPSSSVQMKRLRWKGGGCATIMFVTDPPERWAILPTNMKRQHNDVIACNVLITSFLHGTG